MLKYMIGTLVVLGILGAAFFLRVVPEADRRLNPVYNRPPYPVSPAAARVHDRLRVVDLHADFLLWNRNLLQRYERGHLDLPRLIEGNVALQTFSVVTKSPWGQNYEETKSDSDRITLLAVAQCWPIRTWGSLLERALYQADRLHMAAARSGGRLTVIRTAEDLNDFLARRERDKSLVAGMLAIEGLHALEGSLEHVDVLFDAGFRMMAPTHMFDNTLAGSAQGSTRGGLTDFGRQVIRRLDSLHVTIDLAHLSSKAIDEVLDRVSRPVVISHTGVEATCGSQRNISDEHIRRIAAGGGIIGIGLWDRAVCGTEIEDVVRAIRHVVQVGGIDCVAIGSDFDGTVKTLFDVTGLPVLTEALLQEGFTEEEVSRIMGGNALRLFQQTLPADAPSITRN